MRKEFSKRTKLEAFQRAKGQCEECDAKLSTGNIEYDHIIPAALGGDNSLGNVCVSCRNCHRTKTSKKDIPAIAKSNRARAKHIGARRRGRSFATNRDQPFKRKITGEIVRRDAK